jgi:hypothetical protein
MQQLCVHYVSCLCGLQHVCLRQLTQTGHVLGLRNHHNSRLRKHGSSGLCQHCVLITLAGLCCFQQVCQDNSSHRLAMSWGYVIITTAGCVSMAAVDYVSIVC